MSFVEEAQVEADGITLGPKHTHGTSDSPFGIPKGAFVGPLPTLKRKMSTSPTPANTPTWPHGRNLTEQLNNTHLTSHLGEFTDSHQDPATAIWESTLRT